MGELPMAVVLQHQILHLSLPSYLSNPISLSHEDKYNVNVKVKNKTEPKDLTHYFKSVTGHGILVKVFESCLVIQ